VKTVLFVAYYFPPILAPGAMRPLGFCRYLETYGWRPWVLTTSPGSVYPPHQMDEELLGRLPPGLKIESVPYGNLLHRMIAFRDRLRRMLCNGRSLERTAHGALARSDASEGENSSGSTGRSAIKDLLLDWAFAFPDPQRPWFKASIRHLASLRREEFPDAVIATGGPWTSYLIARALSRRFEVPLILDYRDPWTSNPYISFGSSFLNHQARQLERSICREAARIVTNTEDLRQRLCADYPEIAHKSLTIPNGFDREALGLMNASEGLTPSAKLASKEGYELCHFGTLYGKRTPIKLLQAVKELYQDGQLTPGQIRLRFVGTWNAGDATCETLAQDLEKQGVLRRESVVSHQRCVRQMKQADILLVLQPDSPLQIPQKIYEYLAVGRPLLLIGGQGATAGLLARHQLNVGCQNDVASIKQLLHRLVGGELALSPPPASAVERFDYRTLTRELAAQLDAVCGGYEQPIVQETPKYDAA